MDTDMRALFEESVRGDVRALSALIERLRPPIAGTIRSVLVRQCPCWLRGSIDQEVEDLTQMVFAALFADDNRLLRAWEPDRGSLRTFCRQVARARTLDFLRRRSRRPWAERAMAPDRLAYAAGSDTSGSLEERVAYSQIMTTAFHRVRTKLSPSGQELFSLMFEQQRTTAELTEVTGMSSSALDQRRSRMRRQLREALRALEE